MSDVVRVLIINGSYRNDGVTDQAVAAAARSLEDAGAQTETIYLRDHPIEFCLNCRECNQQPGDAPGRCVIDDGMRALIERIEQADAYVLASPTNFGSVTALFKRFMERLIPYAYWPWDAHVPAFRKARAPRKKALLISSCAAPGLLGRLLYGTRRQLRETAQVIGAEPVGSVFAGLVGKAPRAQVTAGDLERIRGLAAKLVPS